jgi:hypothetical protein
MDKYSKVSLAKGLPYGAAFWPLHSKGG